MRVIVIQPSIPNYRIPFFALLASHYSGKFIVYSSDERLGILTQRSKKYEWEESLGDVINILPGIQWQKNALNINIKRGDVVVLSGAPRCISNIILLIKCRLIGAKVMWWGHLWSSTSKLWSARLRLFVARYSNGLMFYTELEESEYEKKFCLRSKIKTFSLNNGLDLDNIRLYREKYEASMRDPRILFIGRITKKSNLHVLIRALSTQKCKNIKLDIIGDGEYIDSVKQFSTELGLFDKIVWHKPTTDEQEIAEVANKCRIFVYPGSVGLSLIHGMAYGLPSIVHNDRWKHMPEIAAHKNNVNGIVFIKEDYVSLANSIYTVINDIDFLNKLSDESIITTNESFNVHDMSERFISAVEMLSVK